MSERIKLSGDVEYVRNEVQACSRELSIRVNLLVGQDQLTRGGWMVSGAAEKVRSRFCKVEKALRDVQLGTNALGGIRKFPQEKSITYKVAPPRGNTIFMDESTFQANLNVVKNLTERLKSAGDRLQSVWKKLSETKVTDQLVSSLDAVDFLFPVLGSLSKAAAISSILSAAMREINAARGDIYKLVVYFQDLARELDAVRLLLKNAESQAARKLYEDELKRSQTFQDRSAPRDKMKASKAELEARQAEYKVIFGVESKELAAEIARIKKLLGTEKIYLQPNMGNYSMNQNNYSYFCVPYGGNMGCCATAYAIGLSIVTGNPVNPTKHWDQKVGTTRYTSGHYGGAVGNSLSKIYKGLLKKKPTMYHYRYTYIGKDGKKHASQHWVLVVGIREGADPEHLTYADFTVIDPASGKQRNLGDIAKKTSDFAPQADSWQFS